MSWILRIWGDDAAEHSILASVLRRSKACWAVPRGDAVLPAAKASFAFFLLSVSSPLLASFTVPQFFDCITVHALYIYLYLWHAHGLVSAVIPILRLCYCRYLRSFSFSAVAPFRQNIRYGGRLKILTSKSNKQIPGPLTVMSLNDVVYIYDEDIWFVVRWCCLCRFDA